jgi:hypothetical protein
MKKLFLLLTSAALIAAAASCNKAESPVEQSEEAEYTEVTFNVNVDGVDVQTRASTGAGDLTGVESENKLTTVDIFVFENNMPEKIAAYKQYDNNRIVAEGGMTMKLKTNVQYNVYAIANANLENVADITTSGDLMSTVFPLSWDHENLVDDAGLQMMGSAGEPKTFTADENTLSIPVKRIAARVRLVKVTNNLPAAAGDVTIKNVFLSNVAGEWSDSEEFKCEEWYNKYGRTLDKIQNDIDGGTIYKFPFVNADNAECDNATFKSLTTDDNEVKIEAAGSYTTPVSLYCYANNSTVVPAGFYNGYGTWKAFAGQHTMLVVETLIGSETYYYPIDLNKRINANNNDANVGIERNKSYDVSLTINNYGTSEPNEEISTLTAGYTVTVGNWDDGGTIDADF